METNLRRDGPAFVSVEVWEIYSLCGDVYRVHVYAFVDLLNAFNYILVAKFFDEIVFDLIIT